MILSITSVGLADGSLPTRARIVARACTRGVSLPTSGLLRS